MKLFYMRLSRGNFGDDLNLWLWDRIFPGILDDDDRCRFLGIGSLLSERFDDDRQKVVFGTGSGYFKLPRVDERWHFYFVRGPLTARSLGLAPEMALADAAYCLGLLDWPNTEKRFPASFMCHHMSEPDVDWRSICAAANLHYISPTDTPENCLLQIRQSELVITEAMHGAIVADVFRIPWIPLRYGYRSLDFKWHDWCASMALNYEPLDLPPILQAELPRSEFAGRIVRRGMGLVGLGKPAWKRTPVRRSSGREIESLINMLSRLPQEQRPQMSREPAFARVMQQLGKKVESFKADVASGLYS
jgi:succinoglycan biosynthesis protein ExoV